MGSMTLADIREELRENLNNRDDVLDARLDRWINHAYQHMTHPSVHKFEDLAKTYDITLVSGTQSYSLAAATVGYRILAIRSVAYYHAAVGSIVGTTRRRRLNPKPIQWFDSRIHASTEPQHYTIGEDQSIMLSGIPNNTNTIRMRVWQEALPLTESDTTELPEYFDEVLLTGAQAWTEFKLDMRDKSNETFQLYNSMLQNVENKDVLEANTWGIETSLMQRPHMGGSS